MRASRRDGRIFCFQFDSVTGSKLDVTAVRLDTNAAMQSHVTRQKFVGQILIITCPDVDVAACGMHISIQLNIAILLHGLQNNVPAACRHNAVIVAVVTVIDREIPGQRHHLDRASIGRLQV